jgi:hypothetical protein
MSRLRNPEYVKKPFVDFENLRFGKKGNLIPCDIDGFIDFGGKLFVIIEFKHGTAPIPYGQRLALERLCDACEAGGVPTLLILGHHEEEALDGDIDAASVDVSMVRWKGKWHIDVFGSVKSIMERALKKEGLMNG